MRFSKKLQVATVSVVDRDSCNAIYDGEITFNMICAESKTGSPATDACQVRFSAFLYYCFIIKINPFTLGGQWWTGSQPLPPTSWTCQLGHRLW